MLSGTPASSGTFPLTVAATDSVTGAVGSASLSGGLVVSAAQVVNVTISSNANNVDFRSLLTAAGWGGSTPVAGTVTIASGVWIGSSSTGTPALAISGSFPSGSTLVLVNNGHVSGAGGYQNSAVGGTAIQASVAVAIQNNGYIWGGGGAGGHAGTVLTGFWSDSSRHSSTFGNGGAGGGGGGTVAGWGATATAGYAGSNGSGCHGGAGGAPGYGGAAGTSCGYGGSSAGGSAGNYIVGNSYVTWSTAGTRLGGAS